MAFAPLILKKRRNHKTVWFCTTFIFTITTRNT